MSQNKKEKNLHAEIIWPQWLKAQLPSLKNNVCVWEVRCIYVFVLWGCMKIIHIMISQFSYQIFKYQSYESTFVGFVYDPNKDLRDL